MRQVDCVVFDIGNVLVRWSPLNLYRRMGYADAETAAILAETRLIEVNHRILDAGKGRFGPVMAELAGLHPAHATFLSAFDERWTELLGGPIEENVRVLVDLKRAGVPVHAISNFNREKFDVTRAMYPFLDSFDELVLSGDVGVVKPDPEIFELLVSRRGFDPARAVFIDDVAENIAAARNVGFRGIVFEEGRTDLRRALLDFGIASAGAAAPLP